MVGKEMNNQMQLFGKAAAVISFITPGGRKYKDILILTLIHPLTLGDWERGGGN